MKVFYPKSHVPEKASAPRVTSSEPIWMGESLELVNSLEVGCWNLEVIYG